MGQTTTEEVIGSEVGTRSIRFGLDLCAYGPLVRMATIINRAVIQPLGDVVRLAVNRVQVVQDVANLEFSSNALFACIILMTTQPYFLTAGVAGDVKPI